MAYGYQPTIKQPQSPVGPWARVGPAAIHAQPFRPPGRGASGGQAVIPPSYYDPKWSEQLDAGKRSTEHEVEGLETKNQHGEQDYGITQAELAQQQKTALGNLGTTRERQNQNAQQQLARLAESYKKLGVRQNEGANTAGVLYGGAVLQSAAKRAANEGVQKQGTEQTLARQLQDDQTQEGQIKEGNQNALARALLGRDRENENINEFEIPYAKENIQAFGQGIKREEGKEASERGYEVPGKAKARSGRGKPAPQRSYAAQVKRIKSRRGL